MTRNEVCQRLRTLEALHTLVSIKWLPQPSGPGRNLPEREGKDELAGTWQKSGNQLSSSSSSSQLTKSDVQAATLPNSKPQGQGLLQIQDQAGHRPSTPKMTRSIPCVWLAIGITFLLLQECGSSSSSPSKPSKKMSGNSSSPS